VTKKFYVGLLARLKADLVRPVICHISFLVRSDAAIRPLSRSWPIIVGQLKKIIGG